MPPQKENIPNIRRLEDEVRKLTLKVNDNATAVGSLRSNVKGLTSAIGVIQQVQTSPPAAPAANFLWNGEIGHSVNSWNDSAYTTDDKSKEVAFFFSHHKPFVPIGFTTISSANKIPATAHGVENGTLVELSTDGTLPTGPAVLTRYYSYAPDANNIKLATTQALALAGTPDVGITAATGSGNHKIAPFLYDTDARTTSLNQELKSSTHSTYDINYSDWNRTRGLARLNGTRTLDTPIPANFLEPGMTAHTGVRIAKRNSYIEVPDEVLFYGGIVDNTQGVRDFIQGDLGFAAVATINGATTVSRKYRMYVETDRGYSILSPEVTVNAPNDGQYNSTNFVNLSWLTVAGYRNIQLWMYTTGTGVYRLIQEISSGTSSFVDNGAYVRTGVGYPTATTTARKAVFYTRTGELADLAADPSPWDSAHLPIYVPDNYNKAATTDRQWLRLGMTGACNLSIPGCDADGTDTITVPSGVFESVYDAFWNAGTIQIDFYDADGNLSISQLLLARLSATRIQVDGPIDAGTYTLRVLGGGFHGILLDKIHTCLQANVTFAPSALDVRTLQPVAAPDTGQGGIGPGPGGDHGGGITCVAVDTPIELRGGEDVSVQLLEHGNYLAGENMRPNLFEAMRVAYGRTRIVRTANGIEKRCTNSHRFRMTDVDEVGTSLANLRIGDLVMTNLDGRDVLSPLVFIGELGEPEPVYHPRLAGGHYYRAGEWKPKWWQSVLIALGVMKSRRGKIYAHNNKPPSEE